MNDILSICSLLFSLVSLIISIISMRQTQLISYGQLETDLRLLLSDAKKQLVEYIQNNKEEIELRTLNLHKENLLNAYEELCAKYIDKKVDRRRFKKMYFSEIKNIVEDVSFKDLVGLPGKYEAVKKVYNKWFIFD